MAVEAKQSNGKSSMEMSPGRPISPFGDYERLLPEAADKPYPMLPGWQTYPTWFVATDGPTAILLSRKALEEFNRREDRYLKIWEIAVATFRYNGKYDLYEITLLTAEDPKKEKDGEAFLPPTFFGPPVRLFALVAIDLDEGWNIKVILVHEVSLNRPWPPRHFSPNI